MPGIVRTSECNVWEIIPETMTRRLAANILIIDVDAMEAKAREPFLRALLLVVKSAVKAEVSDAVFRASRGYQRNQGL